MKLQQSVATCFRKFITFSGRASRSEYWWFCLVFFIFGAASQLIYDRLYLLFALVFLPPLVSVSVRRLHDIGRSGWWYVLGMLLPVIGSLMLLYFHVQPSESGTNAYGPEPESDRLIAPA